MTSLVIAVVAFAAGLIPFLFAYTWALELREQLEAYMRGGKHE